MATLQEYIEMKEREWAESSGRLHQEVLTLRRHITKATQEQTAAPGGGRHLASRALTSLVKAKQDQDKAYMMAVELKMKVRTASCIPKISN